MIIQKQYNVLWVDDECSEMELFSKEAEANDIILHGFASYEEAFENFETRIFEYDAILLDAVFFKSKNQVAGSEDLKGLAAAKEKIAELRRQRIVPFFILSGQTQLDNNITFSDSYGAHYRKSNPDDVVKLFIDIKAACDKQEVTQIRHRYQNVFEVCTDAYIGKDTAKSLLEILKHADTSNDLQNPVDLFNPLRKIVEKLFTSFHKLGLLPDEIINDKGWINQSSLFLSGSHTSYPLNAEILTPLVSFLLKCLLQVIQDASHAEGTLKLKVDQHVKLIQTHYLYKSVVYQLIEILVWYKKYADENQDKEVNKSKWKRIISESNESYEGEIQQDSQRNYYCGEFLLSFKLVESNYCIGDRVRITDSSINSQSKTKDMYPKFATKFSKI